MVERRRRNRRGRLEERCDRSGRWCGERRRRVSERSGIGPGREELALEAFAGTWFFESRVVTALHLRAKVADLVDDRIQLRVDEQQREQRGEKDPEHWLGRVFQFASHCNDKRAISSISAGQ